VFCSFFGVFCFLGANTLLVAKEAVQEAEAHRRLVVLRLLALREHLGEVADEQPDVLHGLVVADVVADVAGRDGLIAVRGDLDDAQLREVEAHDWRERRVDLLHDVVAPRVLVVVGRRAVEAVQRLADVAECLVDHVGRLVGAPHVVGHGERLLVVGHVLADVIHDLVVRDALHVDVNHVVPDVGVAAVLALLLEDLVAAHLVGLAALGADDERVDRFVLLDAGYALLERERVCVFHRQVVEAVGVVDRLSLALLVAREDVEQLLVVLAKLLGVVHHVVVLVVDQEETVRLVRREAVDEPLAVVPVLVEDLVEHLAVRLGRVEVARIVDVRDGRGAEEPVVLVVVHVDHRALEALLDLVGVLRLQEVVVDRHALRDLVRERDDDVLADGLVDVDDDAARLLIQVLEVRHIAALVGVVEEDERAGLENLLHLEHRVVLVRAHVVLQAVGEGDLLILLRNNLEHLENVGEVGRVHFFQVNQLYMLSSL